MKKAMLVLALVVLSACKADGIVAVNGWANGVAFCEKEYHWVVFQKEVTVWNDGMASYVVNAGHENDEQLQHLKDLVHLYCPTLDK